MKTIKKHLALNYLYYALPCILSVAYLLLFAADYNKQFVRQFIQLNNAVLRNRSRPELLPFGILYQTYAKFA